MSDKAPKCNRCGQELTVYEVSYSHVNGNLPTLYGGVICTKCGRVECMACKNGPAERPCSWCGYPVVAADADEITAVSKGKGGGRRRVALGLRERSTRLALGLVLLAALVIFALPVLQLHAPRLAATIARLADAPKPEAVPAPSKTAATTVAAEQEKVPAAPQIPAVTADISRQAEVSPSPVAVPETDVSPRRTKAGPKSAMNPLDAQSLIGLRVRIHTRDGRVIEGYVTEEANGSLTLQRMYSSGTFTMVLPRNEVESIVAAPLRREG